MFLKKHKNLNDRTTRKLLMLTIMKTFLFLVITTEKKEEVNFIVLFSLQIWTPENITNF